MSFEHVLVPTDFSEAAEGALSFAAALASRLGASLTTLHVIDLPARDWSGIEDLGVNVRNIQVKLLERTREHLQEEVAALAGAAGIEIAVRARAGDAAPEILGEVQEGRMDLVVMATHGRTGLPHLLLGSVAEKVLRRSPVPVMTLRSSRTLPESGLRLLVPTDFSDASLAALPAAGELASKLGATVSLLHVLDEPHLSVGTFEEALGLSPEELQRRLENRARKALRERVQALLPEGVDSKLLLRSGAAPEGIVRVAESGGHDLVVMATAGHSGLGERLLGSTAERVVRSAPCPVVTVRAAG